MSVRRTPLAIPQGNGVGCNTTSPFAGSRHYVSDICFTGEPVIYYYYCSYCLYVIIIILTLLFILCVVLYVCDRLSIFYSPFMD